VDQNDLLDGDAGLLGNLLPIIKKLDKRDFKRRRTVFAGSNFKTSYVLPLLQPKYLLKEEESGKPL
jgi:hypothetical protein